MNRITDDDIRRLVARLNTATGAMPGSDHHVTAEWAYGQGSRLMTKGGSREITARLRNRDMWEVLHAMLTAIDLLHGMASEMLTGGLHPSLIARWATGN